jgi:hypothetical protein
MAHVVLTLEILIFTFLGRTGVPKHQSPNPQKKNLRDVILFLGKIERTRFLTTENWIHPEAPWCSWGDSLG